MQQKHQQVAELDEEVAEYRTREYGVDLLFVNRWSPRAMTGETLAEEEFDAEAMVAVGERADPETLPEELQERERPSDRKPLEEIVSKGSFE